MIVGLGIDNVDIKRIEKIYARFGIKFAQKILGSNELNLPATITPYFLGGRFAAKEAAVKALGTGFTNGISPMDIEILNDPLGAPQLIFYRKALDRAHSLRAIHYHISISHENSIATAIVILEA